jgi:hypothetical protein
MRADDDVLGLKVKTNTTEMKEQHNNKPIPNG